MLAKFGISLVVEDLESKCIKGHDLQLNKLKSSRQEMKTG